MKILIIAEKFPNRIQPWFANIVAQIVANGNEVVIFSLLEGDNQYTSVVSEYSLLNHTKVIKIYGYHLVLTALSNLLYPHKMAATIRGFFKFKSDPKIFPSWIKRSLYRLALAPFCALDDIDIIHSHFEMAGYRFLPLIQSLNVPFVVTFHGLPPPGVPKITPVMRKRYTESADLILLNTKFAKNQYVSLGADEKKIQILPQGTDTIKFTYSNRPIRDRSGIHLLSVGRLSVDKGHVFTIRAIYKLIQSGVDVRLRIVGQGPDYEELGSLVEDLGLKEFVSIESGLSEDELMSRYHDADIFVLSSISSQDGSHVETQGVVLQEAQATGALVIATRVGGIPECIDDGVNGLLIDEKSSDQIAEKILWLIDNLDRWDQIRFQARRHVEENYSIELIGEKLIRYYKSLIARKEED